MPDPIPHAGVFAPRGLLDWEQAPSARASHPAEDHLIPLMVAVGAAETEPGARIYRQADFMDSISSSSFRFGDTPIGPD